MKSKVRLTFYLPRRLVRVLEDIMPLFEDSEAEEPNRGARTRALEVIIQYYMESDEYTKKRESAKRVIADKWHLFAYISKKEMEYRKSLQSERS